MAELKDVTTEQLVAELLQRQQRPQAPVDIVVKHITQGGPEVKDSLELGTPGKGGALKIYFDAGAEPSEINRRIDAAFAARSYAQARLVEQNGGGQQ